jgi:hypothetical protein
MSTESCAGLIEWQWTDQIEASKVAGMKQRTCGVAHSARPFRNLNRASGELDERGRPTRSSAHQPESFVPHCRPCMLPNASMRSRDACHLWPPVHNPPPPSLPFLRGCRLHQKLRRRCKQRCMIRDALQKRLGAHNHAVIPPLRGGES